MTVERVHPPWERIDTVLLDLDGTLLDLYFDNHFFLEHLPRRLAELRDLPAEHARDDIARRYREVEGTLDWYCLDYWRRTLALDVVELKAEVGHLVQWRPHAAAFLEALGSGGKRRVLATNAHPESIAFKFERITLRDRLDALYSAHELGAPKEDPHFWDALLAREGFDPRRTLFFDDNPRVLRAAREWGLPYVIGIVHPDSQREPHTLEEFPAVVDFDRIVPPPTAS